MPRQGRSVPLRVEQQGKALWNDAAGEIWRGDVTSKALCCLLPYDITPAYVAPQPIYCPPKHPTDTKLADFTFHSNPDYKYSDLQPRLLTRDEATPLLEYGRLIRSLRITSSFRFLIEDTYWSIGSEKLLQVVWGCSRYASLFPRLEDIQLEAPYCTDAGNVAALLGIVNLPIRVLGINAWAKDGAGLESLESLLNGMESSCSLRSLSLILPVHMQAKFKFELLMAAIIPRFPRPVSLKLSHGLRSAEILQSSAQLQHLEQFEFKMDAYSTIIQLLVSDLYDNAFPSLKSLRIDCPIFHGVSNLNALFNGITSVHIESLTLNVCGRHLFHLRDALQIIADKSHATVASLDLILDEDSEVENKRSQLLDILQPVFICHSLQRLSIMGVDVDVFDEHVFAIAPAWPRLQILYLGTAKQLREVISSTTRASLLALAKHCSELRVLTLPIHFDAECSALAGEATVTCSLPRLEVFGVLHSVCERPVDGADFLGAMFPLSTTLERCVSEGMKEVQRLLAS